MNSKWLTGGYKRTTTVAWLRITTAKLKTANVYLIYFIKKWRDQFPQGMDRELRCNDKNIMKTNARTVNIYVHFLSE